MSKVFFDTNVLLDLLLERWIDSLYAKSLFSAVIQKKIVGNFSIMSITTIIYLLQKNRIPSIADKITLLLKVFNSIPCDSSIVSLALTKWFIDLEDAIQYCSALNVWCTSIITNDKKWFVNASLPVYTPQQYIDKYL